MYTQQEYRYTTANNKYTKGYDKNNKSSCIQYQDHKNCNEESDKVYFLEFDFQELELQTFSMIYYFHLTK